MINLPPEANVAGGTELTEICMIISWMRERTERYSWSRFPPNRFLRYSGMVITCRDRHQQEFFSEPSNSDYSVFYMHLWAIKHYSRHTGNKQVRKAWPHVRVARGN
jgi:hypothetical protein